VIRFDDFRPGPGTGERTDVHALSLRSCWEGPWWSTPVQTRLLLGEPVKEWRAMLRRRLVPGAQLHFADGSLRRPVGDPSLIGAAGWADAGTGFALLRLLDFLDVSTRIDLVGFGLPGVLSRQENEWVAAHAKTVEPTGMRTALR
jgi:hypothetical protein